MSGAVSAAEASSSLVAGARALVIARVWALAVWAAMAVWAVVLFAIAREAFLGFRTGRFDLGNMVQAVWSTAHGRPLEVTNGYTGEQMVRIGGHVDPILAALAPLWLAAPTPVTLIAVQIAAVALGALPIFLLGRRHLGEPAAVLLALAYLAYPWVAWTAVDAFHPVTLAIPLYLSCVWALDSDRIVTFAVFAVPAAMTGELMAIPLAALGIWYAVARGRRRAGTVIALAGVGWVVVALYAAVPMFSGGASVFYGAYREVGSSPLGVAGTTVTEPFTVLSELSRPGDFLYVFLLALPVGGVFLLSPGMAAVALPQLGANLLSGVRWTTDPHSHYIAAIVPFLFAAICLGLARLSQRGRLRGAALVLTLSIAATVVAGPWPGSPGTPASHGVGASPAHVRSLREAVALVPHEAAVTTTNRVGAHLSARQYVYSIPVIGRAEWIVLETSDVWMPQAVGGYADPGRLRTFRREVERSPGWTKVLDRHGVLVFRKVRS